eukprot:gene6725-3396_t
MASRSLRVIHCGASLVKYADGLWAQETIAEHLKKGIIACDTLLLLQHRPVYTIGKRGRDTDFRIPLEELISKGAEIYSAPRGGEVTFHGPGQLVAYPIIQLREARLGARKYVETLEDSIISTVGAYGIKAHGRLKGATGVWVDDRKIAAIGVRISHGISSHGLALNISTDLGFFQDIIPCGISDKSVTSVGEELRQMNNGTGLSGADRMNGSTGLSSADGMNGIAAMSGADRMSGEVRDIHAPTLAHTYPTEPEGQFEQVSKHFVDSFTRHFKYDPSMVEIQRVEEESLRVAVNSQL